MLTIAYTAIVGSVDAIVSALKDGVNLIANYQGTWTHSQDERQGEQRKQNEQKIVDLQRTLSTGSTHIRECYDLYYRGMQLRFANGDSKSSQIAI